MRPTINKQQPATYSKCAHEEDPVRRSLPLYFWGMITVFCGVIIVDRTLALFSQAWTMPAVIMVGFITSFYIRYHSVPSRRLFLYVGSGVFLLLLYTLFFNSDLLPLKQIFSVETESLESKLYLILCYAYLWAAVIRSYTILRDKDIFILLVPTLSIEALLTVSMPSAFNIVIMAISVIGLVAAMRSEALLEMAHLGDMHRRYGHAKRIKPDLRMAILLILLITVCTMTAVSVWNNQRYFDRLFFRISWRMIHWFTPQVKIESPDSWSHSPFIIGPVSSQGDERLVAIADTDISFYWRETSYENYDGKRWQATFRKAELINASGWTRLSNEDLSGRRFTIDMELISPPSPFLPVPYCIKAINIASVLSYSNEYASVALQSDSKKSMRYAVTSVIPSEIPEEEKPEVAIKGIVAADYIQLPALSSRTVELGRKITAGLDRPWEKARAIQRYLMTNYNYSLNVGSARGESVDYFLFESKRGHCQYFATAMAVLARINDIPSRFTTGYLAEEVDAQGRTVIRLKDAHAWAELNIPGHGWVLFDATPGKAAQLSSSRMLMMKKIKMLFRNRRLRILPIISIMLSIVGLAYACRQLLRRRAFNRNRKAMLGEAETFSGTAGERIEQAYFHALLFLNEIGMGRHIWETPREHLRRLIDVGAIIPALHELTEMYLAVAYILEEPDDSDADRAMYLYGRILGYKGSS